MMRYKNIFNMCFLKRQFMRMVENTGFKEYDFKFHI